MVLAEADEVDPQRVGEDRLLDDVADDVCMRGFGREVAEGVEAEFELHRVSVPRAAAAVPPAGDRAYG